MFCITSYILPLNHIIYLKIYDILFIYQLKTRVFSFRSSCWLNLQQKQVRMTCATAVCTAVRFLLMLTVYKFSPTQPLSNISILRVGACRRIFHEFSLTRQLQKCTVITDIVMKVGGYLVLCVNYVQQPQALTLNISNIEGSMLLSCKDPLALGKVIPKRNHKKVPLIAQLITSPADCQNIFLASRQTSVFTQENVPATS